MVSLEFTPYAERRTDFLGVRSFNGSQIKIYSIVYGNGPLERGLFEEGLARAAECIPAPDLPAGRPGLGFTVLHQGKTGDYVIVCWWDRENELPTRVFLRDGQNWRPARESESFKKLILDVIEAAAMITRNIIVGMFLSAFGFNGVSLLHAQERFADDFEGDLSGWQLIGSHAIQLVRSNDPNHGQVMQLQPDGAVHALIENTGNQIRAENADHRLGSYRAASKPCESDRASWRYGCTKS